MNTPKQRRRRLNAARCDSDKNRAFIIQYLRDMGHVADETESMENLIEALNDLWKQQGIAHLCEEEIQA